MTAVWGMSFVVVKNVLREAPPLAFLFWRFFFASVLLGTVALRRPRSPGVLRHGALGGLLLASAMSLQVLGQGETSASKAAFLTGLSVVLTPFAAYLRTRRLPSLENAIGITLASIGFVLLTFPEVGVAVNRGDVLVFGCGIVFAFYIVDLGERAGAHDLFWLTAVQVAVVALFAGSLSLLLRAPALAGLAARSGEARPLVWTGAFFASVLYLGSIGTVGTFLGQTWAQRHISATHAAIVFALEPLFAALLAAWLLRERLGRRGMLAGVLVLAGIVVSELRLRAAASRKRFVR